MLIWNEMIGFVEWIYSKERKPQWIQLQLSLRDPPRRRWNIPSCTVRPRAMPGWLQAPIKTVKTQVTQQLQWGKSHFFHPWGLTFLPCMFNKKWCFVQRTSLMGVMQKVNPFKSSAQVSFTATEWYLFPNNFEVNLDLCIQVSTAVTKTPSSESLERGSDGSQVRAPYFYPLYISCSQLIEAIGQR